jgi:hypothetical protein
MYLDDETLNDWKIIFGTGKHPLTMIFLNACKCTYDQMIKKFFFIYSNRREKKWIM